MDISLTRAVSKLTFLRVRVATCYAYESLHGSILKQSDSTRSSLSKFEVTLSPVPPTIPLDDAMLHLNQIRVLTENAMENQNLDCEVSKCCGAVRNTVS